MFLSDELFKRPHAGTFTTVNQDLVAYFQNPIGDYPRMRRSTIGWIGSIGIFRRTLNRMYKMNMRTMDMMAAPLSPEALYELEEVAFSQVFG
ncbi:MAG: hypothetical protein R2825_07775 [Saprospiraceae bacterium]